MQQTDDHSVHELYGGHSFNRGQSAQEDEPTNSQNQQCLSRGIKPDKKINSTKRTIRIKVQECKKNIQRTPEIKQCRICLEGELEGRMIAPCLCSGTVTFVHQKCIMEWIKRRHDPKASKNKLLCEMCHTPFSYKYAKRRKFDMQEFCQNYQKEKCNFILFYIFVFVLFVVALGLIVIISESSNNTELGLKIKAILIKSENIKIIYISVVFIIMIVLMFLLILFIIEYAVKSELIISQVLSYGQSGIKKKSRIHPKAEGAHSRVPSNIPQN